MIEILLSCFAALLLLAFVVGVILILFNSGIDGAYPLANLGFMLFIGATTGLLPLYGLCALFGVKALF